MSFSNSHAFSSFTPPEFHPAQSPVLIGPDAFHTFENERDQKLPKRSVPRALRALGIPVTEAEVNQYLSSIKELSIDFPTFKKIVERAESTPRPSLQSTLDSATNLFKTDDGKVNLSDMKQVLGVVCEKLDDDDLDDFFSSAPTTADGNISPAELAKLFAIGEGSR